MAHIKDLTGNKYFKLTVIGFYGIGKDGHALWVCKCECGEIKNIYGNELKKGRKSCGCIKFSGDSSRTHGHRSNGAVTPEYEAWAGLIARCTNPNHKKYKDYGGRGIRVCDRWLNSFENFLEDMGFKPSPELSLDRYPNNESGIYEKSNCRWATTIEQNRNRRSNRWIEYNGYNLIITQWALKLNTRKGNLIDYLKTHSFEQAYDFYMSKQ